jgi:transcriptional regulator with XRE-family HTH domain
MSAQSRLGVAAQSARPKERPLIPMPGVQADVALRRSGRPDPWELPVLQELGARLEAARRAADLSPLGLALEIGLSPSGIRSVEAGRVRTRRSRIREWAEVTSIDAEQLLSEFADVIAADAGRPVQFWQPRAVPGSIGWELTRISLLAMRGLVPPPPVAPGERATLGIALWRLRCEAGLTRAQLAVRIGCPRNHVWRVECDRRRPSRDLLNRWTIGLGRPDAAALIVAFEPSSVAPRPIRIRAGDHLPKPAPASLAPLIQSHHAPTGRRRRKEP